MGAKVLGLGVEVGVGAEAWRGGEAVVGTADSGDPCPLTFCSPLHLNGC